MTDRADEYVPLSLSDEGLLFEFLDQHMNANGVVPHLAGVDAQGVPFVAWLNEEGGDSCYFNVTRLVEDDGGAAERTVPETPGLGQVSSLAYPVVVLDRRLLPGERP